MDGCGGVGADQRGRRKTLFLSAALVVAGALLAAGGAGPAEAAFPGERGKIAFSAYGPRFDDAGHMATIEPDGSGRARLGEGPGYALSYSADGQTVAFVRTTRSETERDYNEDIFLMDADGTNVRPLTSSRSYENSPTFSPDGQTVAFVRWSRSGGDVYTKRVDGTGLTRVSDTPGRFEETAAYSPDGTEIAFSAFGRRGGDIWVMGADGSGARKLTTTRDDHESDPDWSPDGSRIAFSSYTFEGGMKAEAASPEGGLSTMGLYSSAVASSVDGERAERVREQADISVMDADGTNRQNLTEGPGYDVLPAFSPDGTEVAFTRAKFSRRDGETADLFAIQADGTEVRRLTDTRAIEFGPDWQPLPTSP